MALTCPMDIDDILAEVDGHAVPLEIRDLQELSRAWVTERSAPEILPWPASLMERVLDRIRQQVGLFCDYVELVCTYSRGGERSNWSRSKPGISIRRRISVLLLYRRSLRGSSSLCGLTCGRGLLRWGFTIISACLSGFVDNCSPRSTNTPSTSSPIRRRSPVSHLLKSNTPPRINLCFTRTTTPLFSRSFRLPYRDWTIRREGSVWLSSRMWIRRYL